MLLLLTWHCNKNIRLKCPRRMYRDDRGLATSGLTDRNPALVPPQIPQELILADLPLLSKRQDRVLAEHPRQP